MSHTLFISGVGEYAECMKYVYLLRCGADHYKVGIANNVNRRVRGLQTSNPQSIKIVSTKLSDDAGVLESAIHKYLQEMKLDGWHRVV